MAEPLLERAVASVADRLAVDWTALEREANSDDDRALIDCLRILGGVGNLHRTMGLDTADSDRSTIEVDPSSDSQVPLSSKWGRFRIDAQVGEGGFGRVYRAWDPELEREVAIKILHRRIADARMREALLREGRALAKIHHPHVVNVFGVETRGDEIGLCMEFVHGSTLEDTLQKERFDARDTALIGSDLCRALDAVHRAGFVHRDVKARNVMRDDNGRVVLMDFGAGQQSQPLSLTGQVSIVGTPLYMAPEVLAGQPATPSSDIYSLGVLLYRLLTGAYPVEGQSVDAIRAAHMQGRRVPVSKRRSDLPAALTRAIDRATTADPLTRYPSTADFLLDLERIAAPANVVERVVGFARGGALAFVALWVVGFLACSFFNRVVGRQAAFNSDTPGMWLEIGLRSTVAPALYMIAMLLVAWTARWILRALTLVPGLDAVSRWSRTWKTRAMRALQADRSEPFAQLAAALGVVGLALILWTFWTLLVACMVPISDVSALELAPLKYDRRFAPTLYRLALEVLLLALGAALIHLRRLRRRDAAPARIETPIWILMAVAVLFAEVPYRLLWNNTLERVEVSGERCYVLGTSTTELLVHCPDVAPPRNRSLPVGDTRIARTGIRESLFSPPDHAR